MSDGEGESLIATRKRRANAGSRLKQLLQAEGLTNHNEDDQDLELLFQEDEDDDEFKVGDKDRYYGSGSEGDESDNEKGDSDRANGSEQENEDEEEDGENNDSDGSVVLRNDNDDMFSDSDSDSYSSDSDIGEKELQKQERQRKRLQQKKSKQIPKIKQRVDASEKPIQKPKKIYGAPVKPETLLSLNRRQSSRSAVVQNKMNLVSKLKDEEKRRSKLKPVQKVEHVELTQEERLLEAIETEKYNVSTLNKYQEQELDKQKKRKALQMSKRKKLENIISMKTCPRYVTIIEEHQLEKFYLTRDKVKKKDRRGRKSDKQKKEEEEARKLELAKQQKLEEIMRLEELSNGKTEDEGPVKKKRRVKKKEEDIPSNEKLDEDAEQIKTEDTEEIKVEELEDKVDEINETPEDPENSTNIDEPTPEVATDQIIPDEAPEVQDAENTETREAVETPEIETEKSTVEPSTEQSPFKSVSFVDDLKQEEDEDSKQTSREVTVALEDIPESGVIYEGPEEKVGANYVSFERNLKINEIKAYLFGEDSLLSASRRFRDVEPMIRIKPTETSVSNTTTIQPPNLDILQNFPVFGDYSQVKKEKVILETRQDIKVVLKTEPPTGIYLANGSKKQCLITGKNAMYFDPKTGMPYHDVESYRIIQKIQEGGFNWCEFPGGGSYVFDRESTRHAKGVPEGFDE